MLSSKEVLERTGISRATLNNYIGSGLLARPEVLPPDPQESGAPRIGYFPDDTVQRIAEIQRLKSQGWSIARIAAHLAGRDPGAPPPAAAPASTPAVRPQPAIAPRPAAHPAPVSHRPASAQAVSSLPSPRRATGPAPVLTPVAVLVSTLQDAGELWLQLPAGEYFELVNEVWLALDGIFLRHGGCHGRHPGEGMVCHFLPQPPASYLWNALSAAHDARAAMREISERWQERKGWDVQLCMNTGIDEGDEWLGALRLSEPLELTVVGDTADRAAQMSRSARTGGVWVTRNLVGKLAAHERERLTYGVPRPRPTGASRPLLGSFARLEELAALRAPTGPIPPAMADLPITELLDLAAAGPENAHPAAR